MSRADCDVCDEYRSKERRDLRIYKEASEAANRIIESQLKQITTLKSALLNHVIDDLGDTRLSNRMADGGYDSRTDDDLEREAKKQLAQEYPDIFREET